MDEKKIPIAGILGILITLGFFAVIFILLRDPQHNHDVLAVLVGSLGGNAGAIVGYYFGSSAGSRVKTEMLAKEATGKNSVPSAPGS
jgi:membrane protein YqaA with SNARE-associated domain